MLHKLSKISSANPIVVLTCIIVSVIFSVYFISGIPVKLAPPIDLKTITIKSEWPGAIAAEIESEILQDQEILIASMSSVASMEASVTNGSSSIVLSIKNDSTLEQAFLELTSRLNTIQDYPADALPPKITLGASNDLTAIAWISVRTTGENTRPIHEYSDFVKQRVKPKLDRIRGLSVSGMLGNRGKFLNIEVDLQKAASLGIDLTKLASSLKSKGRSSGGSIDDGRRQLTLRLNSTYTLDRLPNMIISSANDRFVRLGDFAKVQIEYQEPLGIYSENGGRSITFGLQSDHNVNVPKTMKKVRSVIDELNDELLNKNGLLIEIAYDDSLYINQAISQVYVNLFTGFLMALIILWLFIGNFKAASMAALCIPLVALYTLVIFHAFDRSLNVISLAGLAIGMAIAIDASIIVFENISRHLQHNEFSELSTSLATREVSGAIFASTVTTVAIFLPIVFMDNATGQLFTDLAISIATSVTLSLLLSVTIIPSFMSYFASKNKRFLEQSSVSSFRWEKLFLAILRSTKSKVKSIVLLVIILLGSIGLNLLLFPKLDYLPQGNQNAIYAYISVPSGTSHGVRVDLENAINSRIIPHYKQVKEPYINNYWLGLYESYGFLGLRAVEPKDVNELVKLLNSNILHGLPNMKAYASRNSIFSRLGGGRVVDVHIIGSDFTNISYVAELARDLIKQSSSKIMVRTIPTLRSEQPEYRLTADPFVLSENDWEFSQFSQVMNVLGDGLWVNSFAYKNQNLPVKITSSEKFTPYSIRDASIIAGSGRLLSIGEVASGDRSFTETSIRKIDGMRAITLRISPPQNMTVQTIIDLVKTEVEPQLVSSMNIDTQVTYQGTADALTKAISDIFNGILFALFILYLITSFLFRSFKDSFYVLITIPLATLGGLLSLRLVNTFSFQPLDLITMIGFIILLGLVINNAILLLAEIRRAQIHKEIYTAIKIALHNRTRPILMSTLTTVFGLLPFIVFSGSGSELYRGLASVIVGGVLVNALFTLVLIPALVLAGERSKLN